MNELVKSFGSNAGKVWHTLNNEGPQVQTKLIDKTGLDEYELYAAIGWLAREGKISKEKRTYKIDRTTNLTTNIGKNAGAVWKALETREDIDIGSISRVTKISKRDCYSALGWLAREGKIKTRTTVTKK